MAKNQDAKFETLEDSNRNRGMKKKPHEMTADELDSLWKQRAHEYSRQLGLLYMSSEQREFMEAGYVAARRIAHLEHLAEMKAYKDEVTELLNKAKKELDRLDTLADRIGNNEIING